MGQLSTAMLGEAGQQAELLALLQRDLDQLTTLAAGVAATTDNDQRAHIALRRASYAETTSDFAAAYQAAEKAIALAEETADRHSHIAAQLAQGRALLSQNKHEEARHYLKQTLAAARQGAFRQLEADILRALGVVETNSGHPQAARPFYLQARQLYTQGNNQLGVAQITNNLGVSAYAEGHYSEALDAWEEVIQLHRKMGNRAGLIQSLINLSIINTSIGYYDKARQQSEEAQQIGHEIDMPLGECYAGMNLSCIFYAQQGYETAVLHARHAQQIAQQIGAPRFEAYAIMYLGHALTGLGQFDEAQTVYQQAAALWQELNQASAALETDAGLATLALAQNDLETAQSYVTHILNNVSVLETNDDGTMLHIYLTCYHVQMAAGLVPEAEKILQKAEEMLQQRAKAILDDKSRETFLYQVFTNREILRLSQKL